MLAPGLPGLEALGAASFADLAGQGGALLEEARARVIAQSVESVLLRIPLPGTPIEGDGLARFTAPPRGAGTGFLFVRRYRAARWPSFFVARFTHPRSASLAAREWNLLCRLRSEGIATPEPLAVGEERRGFFARHSVLVTRELERTLSVVEWLGKPRSAEERRVAVRALGVLLQRVHRSRVVLPRLRWEQVRLPESGGACHASEPPAVSALAGLVRRRALEASVTSVRGGRILARPSQRAFERLLASLYRRAPRGRPLSARELVRIFVLATRGSFGRAERRALLARLAIQAAREERSVPFAGTGTERSGTAAAREATR